MMDARLVLLRDLIEGREATEAEHTVAVALARLPSVGLWITRAASLYCQLPSHLQEDLHVRQIRAAVHARLRHIELARVLDLLRGVNVSPTLLKGAAHLAAGLYPDPALRPMRDLDLWVREEDMSRALEALLAAGYTILHKERRPLPLRMRYTQEIELLGQTIVGEAVDLHYRPFVGWWAILAARIPQNELWQRRRTITWLGKPVALLAPEDHFIHLAFHFVVNHHLGSPGIQALVDMALSLRAWPLKWDLLCRRARAWGLNAVMWTALTLLSNLAPNRVPDAVRETLAPPAWQRVLLRALMPRPGTLLQPRPNEGRGRYLLHLLLCESPRLWPRLARWALWPEEEWLRLRYGRTSRFLRLYHILNVIKRPLF